MRHAQNSGLVLLMTFAGAPALADGVYKDRERLEERSATVKQRSRIAPGGRSP
jgi:hypothetical protein